MHFFSLLRYDSSSFVFNVPCIRFWLQHGECDSYYRTSITASRLHVADFIISKSLEFLSRFLTSALFKNDHNHRTNLFNDILTCQLVPFLGISVTLCKFTPRNRLIPYHVCLHVNCKLEWNDLRAYFQFFSILLDY